MKPGTFGFALFLIANYAVLTGAIGQNAYKCGTSYSDAPCPGGVVIDAQDSRSSAQKKQADQATRSTAKAAEGMEASRREQEQADALAQALAPGATLIGPQTPELEARSKAHPTQGKPKKPPPPPDHFTASAPKEKLNGTTADKGKKVKKPKKAAVASAQAKQP
jgi:hypothetical protein